eukprot:2383631-Pyramimonas_sp.AAC.1
MSAVGAQEHLHVDLRRGPRWEHATCEGCQNGRGGRMRTLAFRSSVGLPMGFPKRERGVPK